MRGEATLKDGDFDVEAENRSLQAEEATCLQLFNLHHHPQKKSERVSSYSLAPEPWHLLVTVKGRR